MRVAVIAFQGCLASGVSGFADALAVGNMVAGRSVFTVRTVGAGPSPIQGFSGTPIPADMDMESVAGDSSAWDVVYLPPSFGATGRIPSLVAWVRSAHDSGVLVCAACAGVFILAEAGILKGRAATTHWGLSEEFKQTYPDVRLDTGRILVDGGDYICAGGVTAYFDLALRLVARFVSPEAAAMSARTLLLDPGRSSQTPYMSLLAPVSHGHETVARAQEWMEVNLEHPMGVKELADVVHVSERTLLRRFRKATGHSPKEYLLGLRIELAKRLLATTGHAVEDISARVGYSDSTAFYRLFREMAGVTPGEYRRRFNCFIPG